MTKKGFSTIVLIFLGLLIAAWFGIWHWSNRKGSRDDKGANHDLSIREAIRRAPSVTIYGKVVDTEDQPVAGAKATIDATRLEIMLNEPYHATLFGVADGNGEFQVTVERPYDAFFATVEKEGYLFVKDVESTLDIINHRKSSPENRRVLRMRKSGRPEFQLVAPMENCGPTRLLRVEADGSKSAKWSVTNLKSYNSFWSAVRDLEVEARFDPEKKDWEVTYRALSNDGGILLSEKELFMAPEDGYQKKVSFRTGGVDIRARDTVYHLYLKTRNPVLYAKFDVEQLIGLPRQYPQSFLDLSVKSWTNPYGERNFEPLKRTAENFQAQDAHTEYCLQCINEGRRADPKHLADLLKSTKNGNPQ